MKKLMLNLDELTVESYATDRQSPPRGTVVGHYGTTHTLGGGPTCDLSCHQTCYGGSTCTC